MKESPSGDNENKADKKTDDNGRVPVVSLATVLNSENIRDGSTHHENDADRIHLEELLKNRGLFRNSSTGSLEEDQDNTGRDSTDREVDVEAPSPRNVICEGTTEKGADNASNSVRGTDNTGESRSLLGRGRESDDGVGSGTQTSSSDTRDGASDDEGFGVGSGAADDGADLEDEDGDEERRL